MGRLSFPEKAASQTPWGSRDLSVFRFGAFWSGQNDSDLVREIRSWLENGKTICIIIEKNCISYKYGS
jgi:hypothetical protein